MTTTDLTTALPGPSATTLEEGPRSTALAAAMLSVGVGSVHVALAPEHLQHWWVFGAFFLAVGLCQLGYAAAVLWRPTWQVAMVGIAANVAIILTYVASRTAGLPIGPPEEGSGNEAGGDEGHSEGPPGEVLGYTEAVGPLDLATTAAELVLIGLLVSLLPVRMRAPTCNGLLVVGVALWGLRISAALA